MDTLLKIMNMIIQSLGVLLFTNYIFWVLIIIIVMLYKKSSSIEKTMLGEVIPLKDKILGSIFNGLFGGIIASVIVVTLGITIQVNTGHTTWASSGILYIWVIALLLAIINPRYLCFSYAAGIVALVHLLTGFPDVNVPGLMALVGLLHLVESLLIWMDGHTNAVPIFIKRKDGITVGGFVMKRMWPIPMVILTAVVQMSLGEGSVNMPDWWPIIKHSTALINSDNLAYVIAPIPVILGYGDMSITNTPEARCKSTAIRLFTYSIILILISIISSRVYFLQYIAAIFAPAAHEFIILLGKNEEEKGEAFFKSSEVGLKILYCLKDTPAYLMKLEPGDTILKINNNKVESETQLAEFLHTSPSFIWMDILKQNGEKKTAEYKNYQNGVRSLGALVVPKNSELYFEISEGKSPINRLIGFIKTKFK